MERWGKGVDDGVGEVRVELVAHCSSVRGALKGRVGL